MLTKQTILNLLLLIAALGCDRRDAAVKEDQIKLPAPTSMGITADCVICVDHPMEVKSTTPFSEVEGKRYYFCSDYCKKEFDTDPAKALAKYQEARAPSSQPATAPAGHSH